MSFAKFWIPCPEKTEVEAEPLGTHLLSKGSLKGNKFIKKISKCGILQILWTFFNAVSANFATTECF